MQTLQMAAFVAGSIISVATAKTVHAEGNQDFRGALGVNRRVQSPSQGQTRTAGNLTLQFFQPVTKSGGFDFNVNPRDNKPTAYLGGEAVLSDNSLREVEGGLQFETGVFGGTIGWTCFIARANVGGGNTYTNVRVWNGTAPVAWRDPNLHQIQRDPVTNKPVGATGSISGDTAFEIVTGATNRSYTLQVNAIGKGSNTFYWNANQALNIIDNRTQATAAQPIAPWGADNYNSTDQNQAGNIKSRVKRIVGQTRRNSTGVDNNQAGLDGSWVRGTWANATINGVPWHRTVNGNTITSVDQDETGYNDAPSGSADIAFDKRFNGQRTATSRTIVEFSGAGLTNLTAREGIDQPERYNGETTTINLGTTTRLQGQPVEWE